ncbi:MAG: VCBS repeat-containing protein [Candidatus Eisenbacteria bacterium]|nr:VCBS repeat-containing protein [Candidatus Eisenbacteria bacterium]MCC7140658.1 VCBS repeat-containing protein [Candidatus Eisenbacteria bacterium]
MATMQRVRAVPVLLILILLCGGGVRPARSVDWFGPAQSTPIAGTPVHLVEGQFNSDDYLDWAVVCQEAKIFVGINDGQGVFEVLGPFATAATPRRIAAGDLNSDGIEDLVAIHDIGTEMWLFENDGTGRLDAPQVVDCGCSALSVTVGDLDGDARPDVAVGKLQAISIYWSDGSGAIGAPTTAGVSLNFSEFCDSPNTYLWDLDIADVTDDGLLDVVLVASHDGAQLCGTVFRRGVGLVANHGGRVFDAEASWILEQVDAVGRQFQDMNVFDLDGNGQADISIAPQSSPHRYLFHLGGAWDECPMFTSGGSQRSTVLGDWNGDGLGDAVVSSYGVFRLGRGNAMDGFSLVQADFSGLGAPATGQFDTQPGWDLLGFGTNEVNLYSNLISPVAVESPGPRARRGAAPRLLVAPSVVRAGVERVQLRLIGGASAIGTGERVSVGLYDHGGRLVGGIRKLVARDGHVDLRLGGESRLPSGIYRVSLESTSGRAGASIVVLR